MKATQAIRVGIVDRHEIVRDGLKMFLETRDDMCLAGEAGSINEAIELYAHAQPDVVLLDFPCEKTGVHMVEKLQQVCPQTRTVVLSTSIDPNHVLGAVRAGAAGYMYKQIDIDDLASAILRAFAGEMVFDREVQSLLAVHA